VARVNVKEPSTTEDTRRELLLAVTTSGGRVPAVDATLQMDKNTEQHYQQ